MRDIIQLAAHSTKEQGTTAGGQDAASGREGETASL